MKPLAVRDLASFVFRHGDLYPSGEGRSVEAWEGTAAHTAIQKARGATDTSYAKEVSLKVPVRLVDEDWQLQGRIDVQEQEAQRLQEQENDLLMKQKEMDERENKLNVGREIQKGDFRSR